jgi:hypothetical protein
MSAPAVLRRVARIIAFALVITLSGACGGTGGTQEGQAGAATPAPVSNAWDSWNWDEGAFSD